MGDRQSSTEEGSAGLGAQEEQVPRIAEPAAAPCADPRPVSREGVESLLHAAWAGEPPEALRR